MYLMTQIEKLVQSKLQMAEFNKRFSRMTRTISATDLVLSRPEGFISSAGTARMRMAVN